MRWAKERKGGKIVSAATAKTWGDYRCPTCSAPVFLRSGKYYSEHFAHKAGQAKPTCENFHPAFDLSRGPYVSTTPYETKNVDPLQLGIELEPDAEKHGGRKWRLCLTIPKAFDVHGQIIVDLGLNDHRPISLAKLSLGAETFAVQPDVEEFGASWVSPEVRPEYRDVVQDRIPGLDRTTLNLFEASRSKQQPRAHALSWGEAYYLVTHSNKPVALPQALPNKPLARMNGWDCSLVLLPQEPSAEIEAWFQQFGDLPVGRAVRDWALLYPAPFALGDSGDLHIHSNDYVVLALKSGPETEREFAVSTGHSQSTIELEGAAAQLVVLSGGNRSTENQLYLSWSGAHVATLTTTPFATAAAPIAVSITCDGKERADLHHRASQKLLTEIRLGTRSISGLSGHPKLHGTLRWRHDSSPWESLTICFGPLPNARVDGAILERLNSTLHDRELQIELDFGPFGRFEGDAVPRSPDVGDRETRLPPQLRARIAWLSHACNSYVDASSRPIAALSDKLLLQHLNRLNVPVKLLAHKRALNGQLRRLHVEVDHA